MFDHAPWPRPHRCQEGLDRYDELIGDEQYEYQRELAKKFKDFQIQLQPMVTTHKKMSHGKKARWVVVVATVGMETTLIVMYW